MFSGRRAQFCLLWEVGVQILTCQHIGITFEQHKWVHKILGQPREIWIAGPGIGGHNEQAETIFINYSSWSCLLPSTTELTPWQLQFPDMDSFQYITRKKWQRKTHTTLVLELQVFQLPNLKLLEECLIINSYIVGNMPLPSTESLACHFSEGS